MLAPLPARSAVSPYSRAEHVNTLDLQHQKEDRKIKRIFVKRRDIAVFRESTMRRFNNGLE